MSSSTRTTAAQGKNCVPTFSARNLFCLVMIVMLGFVTASAQTLITPPSTTIQYLGVPNPQNNTAAAVTAPLGGIILKGTAINPATGVPFRHLWVDDATSGICRIDPDLDSPGPYAINLQTCPFKINGASITGGPMSFDPTNHFLDPTQPTVATNYLYFADEQRASEGIIRIGYLPSGDGGHGFLNFASVFVMGGSTTGARFGGGTTGCSLPGNPGTPHSTVLDPLGNLWVGFKKSGTVLRFTQPGTASETGFGTCAQFIVPVATIDTKSDGLAFIGHDLWGTDGTSPFFIKNADTTCMVPPHGICTAPADIVYVLGAAPIGAAAVALMSDQYYPATNGNNVYIALQEAVAVPPAPPNPPDNVAWVGNASAADASMANTTLDVTFMGTFDPLAGSTPPPTILSGVAVDQTDPANVVAFSSDDYSGGGVLAKGMWFQSCQGTAPALPPGPGFTPLNCPTPIATAAPGAPMNVVGVASNNAVTVSWSPAQSNQPVTSYTVKTFVGGVLVSSTPVTPVAGVSLFPPTSLLVSGLTNFTAYTFTVSATNASGTSPDSAPSAPATPPGIAVPAAPTNATAIPGDTQASVSFTVSPPPQGAPITSYLVTSNPGGILVSIPPPASGNIGTALVGGLTNGVTYTFTVQAIDPAGPSAPSAPSNAVTPSAAHVPVITAAVSGPTSVSTAPSQVTYTITVTNPINATQAFPANVNVTHTLTQQPATIAASGASRNSATGIVTITTTTPHALNIGQTITIAGVADASFNGTFIISDVPTVTTLTYAQAGVTATSGSGTVLGLPLANIVVAQTSQGTCTSGGAGVITVTCNQGVMAPGTSSTVTVIVQIQSQAVLSSVVASGTDAAGTLLANANASITTTVPLPSVSTISAPVSVTGNPQNPNPNVGQAGNITWIVSNVSTTPTPNVQLVIFVPTGLNINPPNPPTPTFDNGGTGSCTAASPVAGGNQFVCTTPTLGGPRKNGAKPPSTMTVIINVTPAAGTSKAVFHPTGTVTFGPGGTDTLPNVATLTITVR
ncbi:MAG TPA: fibronectin type III domain-containing protein [Candidatus Angelobacter sp.]|nr:fibronectin type III domain-containing protein [Candidatus Angelobacter sp.]